MELTREMLATENTFHDLAKAFEQTRKIYERYKMAEEDTKANIEQKKNILRAAGILDDY